MQGDLIILALILVVLVALEAGRAIHQAKPSKRIQDGFHPLYGRSNTRRGASYK